jgi:hypothetical protein
MRMKIRNVLLCSWHPNLKSQKRLIQVHSSWHSSPKLGYLHFSAQLMFWKPIGHSRITEVKYKWKILISLWHCKQNIIMLIEYVFSKTYSHKFLSLCSKYTLHSK